jgi:hypothetical protein
MKPFLNRLFSRPWYPIVFSAYPALALLSTNIGQVQADAGIRALLASIALAGVLFFILWLFTRQAHRAAFLTTLWLVLFFTYGHIHNLLSEKYPDFDPDLWLAGGWLLLFALVLFWTTRPRLNFTSSTAGLNMIALALVVMSLWQISSKSGTGSVHALGADHAPAQSDLVKPESPPDVYYFILDSYGRADNLLSAYRFDNSEFLNALEQRGFYVAQCSQANYTRTELSLASSLNMMYLQDLDDAFKPDSTSRRILWDSLKHSAVRYNFDSMGYITVNFANGYAWMELTDADMFLSPPTLSSGMTEFEGLFLRTTLARYVQEWDWVDPDEVMGQNFRDRFNLVFNTVDDIAKMPEPTFAYIHLIPPHPPFVFDADGNPTPPADFWNEKRLYPSDLYAKGIVNQTKYLNKKLLVAIDTILAESKTPPIIILQGDHGPWLQPKDKHMWILNAYYLPGHMEKLYPTISPVNTFRLVFDAYFGGKYDMLEDVSYFSPVPKLYEFSVVPNKCEP